MPPEIAEPSPSGGITLRYWAAAKAAAGTDHDVVDTATAMTLAALTAEAIRRHPDRHRLADVLTTCSVLIDARPANGDDDVLVEPGSSVELLPPFAGG